MKKPGYLTQVKNSNLSTVLRSIWETEPVSRVELVELTGLTSGTITNLTQELIQAGLIRESESISGTVGRKRVLLRFDAQRYIMIGVDIGRTSFEVVTTDLMGRMIRSSASSTAGLSSPDKVIERIVPAVKAMMGKAAGNGNTLLGIGVSIPGPMDMQRGVLLEPPNFPGWASFPLVVRLGEALGKPVIMNDDARTSALAERWFGIGRKLSNLVHITLGAGIGGGVVMNGELIYGANGLYGQVGHMAVVPAGERCACGNHGCWETICSIPSIMRRWSSLSGTESSSLPIGDFFEAVNREEPAAVQCLDEMLATMAQALTTLFNVYDPEAFVISGKLHPYLAPYLPQLQQQVRSMVYPFVSGRVMIESSTFGASQSAVGAAAYVFDAMMRDPLQAIDAAKSG